MRPYYEDEAVTLYHGDCLEILPEMDPVDHVITDPPYGNKATHAGHLSSVVDRQPLGFEGLTGQQLEALAKGWVDLARRWVVFTSEWKYMHLLDEAGLLVRFGIWRKPNGAPQFTGDRPGMGWEGVAICHREGKKRWNGGGRHGVWNYPRDTSGEHPTAKPIGLYRAFIEDFTDPGDVILDPFAGSGTTLRAAKDLGRRAIGIEIDERWCEQTARRMAQTAMVLS